MINFLDSSLGKPVGNIDLIGNTKSMKIEDQQDKSQYTSSVQELEFTEEFETEKNNTLPQELPGIFTVSKLKTKYETNDSIEH